MKLTRFFLNKLKNNKTYIYPTFNGWKFLSLTLILLIAGILYQSNFLLLFDLFIFSFFICMMLYTHENIRPINIRIIKINDGFADEYASCILQIENKYSQSYHIQLQIHDKQINLDNIEYQQKQIHEISFKLPPQRGVHEFNLKLKTDFPFGLFRSFRIIEKNIKFLAYPKPIMDQQLSPELNLYSIAKEEGEELEIATYQPGIPLARVLWNKSHKELNYRKIQPAQEVPLLNASLQKEKDLEATLRTISYWLKKFQHSKKNLLLKLDQKNILLSNQEDYQRELKKLALFHI